MELYRACLDDDLPLAKRLYAEGVRFAKPSNELFCSVMWHSLHPFEQLCVEQQWEMLRWVCEVDKALFVEVVNILTMAATATPEMFGWLVSLDDDWLFSRDRYGFGCLTYASESGNLPVVKWLCEHDAYDIHDRWEYDVHGRLEYDVHDRREYGVDKCDEGVTFAEVEVAFDAAWKGCQCDVAEYLMLLEDFEPTERMFLVACQGASLRFVLWMLESGKVDLEACHVRALKFAFLGGNTDVVEWLYSRWPCKLTQQMFHTACANGNMSLVQWMLRKRSFEMGGPFLSVCINDHAELAKWMWSRGVDLDPVMIVRQLLAVYKTRLLDWFVEQVPEVLTPQLFKTVCETSVPMAAKRLMDMGCVYLDVLDMDAVRAGPRGEKMCALLDTYRMDE